MSAPTTERRMLSLAETAAALGVSEWLVRKQAQTTGAVCGIPTVRIGKRVLVPRDALERVLTGEAVCNGRR